MRTDRVFEKGFNVIPTATIDTNLLQEYWREQQNVAVTEKLLDLAKHGQVDLAITSRISADIPDLPLASRINDLPQLNVQQIGSVFRLGHSSLGGGDVLGSDSFMNIVDSLESRFDREGRVKRRPDWKDWDHLHGHYLSGRDVFLTWDRPILEVASELQQQLGIVVTTPQEFLDSQTELMKDS